MTVTIVLVLLVLLLITGLPVALAMGVSGAAGLYMFGGWPILQGILKTTPLSTANNYEIITIPMFILMAEFIIISGVANDLFRAATVWVGRLRQHSRERVSVRYQARLRRRRRRSPPRPSPPCSRKAMSQSSREGWLLSPVRWRC